MPQDEKLVIESLQDPKSTKEYLQTVIDGIERGRVVLSTEEDELILHPGSLLRFTVKGKKKPGSCKLSIIVSWKEEKKPSKESPETISITS